MIGNFCPQSRLGGSERSLLSTAQYLSSRAALLDTAQLDAAGSRISSLLIKLDQVAEKTAAITGSSDPERDRKVRTVSAKCRSIQFKEGNLGKYFRSVEKVFSLYRHIWCIGFHNPS